MCPVVHSESVGSGWNDYCRDKRLKRRPERKRDFVTNCLEEAVVGRRLGHVREKERVVKCMREGRVD